MTIVVTRCNSMYMLWEMQTYIHILIWLVVYLFAITFSKLRTRSKTIYGGGFYLLGPFGLIQFYFLFSGGKLAEIKGRNGGGNNN